MSEGAIVYGGSPTLAGLKTGNLFTCPAPTRQEALETIRKLNRLLVPRGVRLLVVRFTAQRALVYLYRPGKLKEDLADREACRILKERNYPVENVSACVAEVVRRIGHRKDFPHEVGLFLGYPAEDVDGFIKNHAKSEKCVGTWKVYGDPKTAQRNFARFEKCSRVYRSCYQKNGKFEKLIVPDRVVSGT